MTSVIIAAHNEQTVIGRCLDSLLGGAAAGEMDVTVVANGCTDGTAKVAASRLGVRVIELSTPGKATALNAGEAVAQGFPRVYLDADVVVTTRDVRALCEALNAPVLAAVPRRVLDLRGRPLVVRGYFAVNSRLPAFRDGLFGRGVIVLSETAHARFGRFPEMIADDLFLDSLFASSETRQLDSVSSAIATPRRTADLYRRLVRVRRGNAELRAAAGTGDIPGGVRSADRLSWLRDVVLPRPWLAPAAVCYLAVTVAAAVAARRPASADGAWGRDDSSRTLTDPEGGLTGNHG